MLFTQKEYDFIKESNEIESEVGVDFDHLDAFMEIKRIIHTGRKILTTTDICGTIHRKLMVNKLKRFVGEYRMTDVGIYKGHQLIKQMPAPLLLRPLMEDFIDDFNKMEKTPFELHKQFENIHPFIDGNGRTGRLLWAFDLLRRGQEVVPMLNSFHKDPVYTDEYLEYLKSDRQSFSGSEYKEIYLNTFEAKRQRYYDAL